MKITLTKEQLDKILDFAEERGLCEVIVSCENSSGIGTTIYVEDKDSLMRDDITDYDNW